MKVLIDTTIWSKVLRRKNQPSGDEKIVDALKIIIKEYMDVIIGPIRQELLSGISDEIVFNDLKLKMEGFADYPIETKDYELAAEYCNICRRKGIQGSNTDFLICAIAARNNFEVFTEDKDFNQYKKYIPIKLFDIKNVIVNI